MTPRPLSAGSAGSDDLLTRLTLDLAQAIAQTVERRLAERQRPDVDALLSIPEAASLLGVGRTTAYHLISSGELRSVKVRGRRLVPSSALAQVGDPDWSGGRR